MSNSIQKNGNTILRCANWLFQLYFEKLSDVIKEEKLDNNKNILSFLEQLDQSIWGHGMIMVEITDYFNDQSSELSLKLFHKLTMQAISKIKQLDLGEHQNNYLVLLDEFSKKIL